MEKSISCAKARVSVSISLLCSLGPFVDLCLRAKLAENQGESHQNGVNTRLSA
jgi:hypothetical protein